MTKADKRALAYAKSHAYLGYDYDQTYDAVKYGYLQAEKDLALTKDDVWCVFNLVRELQTKYPATEGCLQEVADIFNEQRKK